MKLKCEKNLKAPVFINPLLVYVAFVFMSAVMPVKTASAESLVITPEMQFSYAEKLYSEKKYDTALHEFRRYVHFFPSGEMIHESRLRIAGCFYGLKKYRQAEESIEELLNEKLTKKMTITAFLHLAECQKAAGMKKKAVNTLNGLIAFTASDKSLQKDKVEKEAVLNLLEKAQLFKARLLLEKGDWEQAKTVYESIPGENNMGNIVSTLDEKQKDFSFAEKDSFTAGALSIFPGAGYLYLGRLKDAGIAFGANALVIGGAYKAFDNDNAPLGVLLSIIGTGFYGGSIYGTIRSAEKHNAYLKQDLTHELLQAYPTAGQPPVFFSFDVNF